MISIYLACTLVFTSYSNLSSQAFPFFFYKKAKKINSIQNLSFGFRVLSFEF